MELNQLLKTLLNAGSEGTVNKTSPALQQATQVVNNEQIGVLLQVARQAAGVTSGPGLGSRSGSATPAQTATDNLFTATSTGQTSAKVSTDLAAKLVAKFPALPVKLTLQPIANNTAVASNKSWQLSVTIEPELLKSLPLTATERAQAGKITITINAQQAKDLAPLLSNSQQASSLSQKTGNNAITAKQAMLVLKPLMQSTAVDNPALTANNRNKPANSLPNALTLQLVAPAPTGSKIATGSVPRSIDVSTHLAVKQLPAPLAKVLVSLLQAEVTTPRSNAAIVPASVSANMSGVQHRSPMTQHQSQQLSPQQFQQVLRHTIAQLTGQPLTKSPDLTSTPAPQLPPIRSLQPLTTQADIAPIPKALPLQTSQQAIVKVLQAVSQQLPSPESMQHPQQLKQWVNDWFAAKPVSGNSQQQMGTLGKMLAMLLGLVMQKSAAPTTSNAATSSQTVSNQLTQAFIDQLVRPSPTPSSTQAPFTGEVRERINQLLLQLPQGQLQRLMQLFTSAINSAQTSQARLNDSIGTQPEYFVLLPASQTSELRQPELLLRPEREPQKDGQKGRTVWLFTLRFELKDYGPLLVKGRYHPGGSRVDFYTSSATAQQRLQQQLGQLEKRFDELKVTGLNLSVQQGKVPDTLAKQQSGIIRITV